MNFSNQTFYYLLSAALAGILIHFVFSALGQAFPTLSFLFDLRSLRKNPREWFFLATPFLTLLLISLAFLFRFLSAPPAVSLGAVALAAILPLTSVGLIFGPTLWKAALLKVLNVSKVEPLSLSEREFPDPQMRQFIRAIEKHDRLEAERILQAGWNLNSFSQSGQTVLTLFCSALDAEAVALMIELGADVNAAETPKDDYYGSWKRWPLGAVIAPEDDFGRFQRRDYRESHDLKAQAAFEIIRLLDSKAADWNVTDRDHSLVFLIFTGALPVLHMPELLELLASNPRFQQAVHSMPLIDRANLFRMKMADPESRSELRILISKFQLPNGFAKSQDGLESAELSEMRQRIAEKFSEMSASPQNLADAKDLHRQWFGQ